MLNDRLVSRRGFFKSAAALAAAAGLPLWYVEECLSQRRASREGALRFGLIGCGGQGRAMPATPPRSARSSPSAMSTPATWRAAKRQFPAAEGYADFRKLLERKDIDAVICGTVDHWHTLVAIAAMKAGKDIYCEKPLTLTIDEGKHLVEVQKETGRILQTGTQQRSDVYFRLACDLVRNERIGKLEKVEVWLPAGLRQGPFATSPVPRGFDFDFWTGPDGEGPLRQGADPFQFPLLVGILRRHDDRLGAHHNDIALWAIDPPEGGPVSVEGKQLVEMIPGGFTAASEYEVRYTYANGVVHECRSTTGSEWNGGVKDASKQQHGIKFIGSQGLDLGHAGRDQGQRPATYSRRNCPPAPSGST